MDTRYNCFEKFRCDVIDVSDEEAMGIFTPGSGKPSNPSDIFGTICKRREVELSNTLAKEAASKAMREHLELNNILNKVSEVVPTTIQEPEVHITRSVYKPTFSIGGLFRHFVMGTAIDYLYAVLKSSSVRTRKSKSRTDIPKLHYASCGNVEDKTCAINEFKTIIDVHCNVTSAFSRILQPIDPAEPVKEIKISEGHMYIRFKRTADIGKMPKKIKAHFNNVVITGTFDDRNTTLKFYDIPVGSKRPEWRLGDIVHVKIECVDSVHTNNYLYDSEILTVPMKNIEYTEAQYTYESGQCGTLVPYYKFTVYNGLEKICVRGDISTKSNDPLILSINGSKDFVFHKDPLIGVSFENFKNYEDIRNICYESMHNKYGHIEMSIRKGRS